MPLVNCPECGRPVSTAAAACPGCGHPMQAAAPAPAGPACYACPAAATTRCQSCGKLSCALHVNSIYVYHGRGGANELRCNDCYSSASSWQLFGCVFGGIAVIGVLIFALAKKAEFDQRWKNPGPGPVRPF